MRFHRSVSFLCHRRNINSARIALAILLAGILHTSGQTPSADTPGVVKLPADASIASALNKPKPAYPRLAKIARIQGSVVIQVNISATGSIEALKVVSGVPLLGQAALDAVKNWRYEPHLVNGAPVAVRTTVNVLFSFDPKTGEPTVEAGVPDARIAMLDGKLTGGPSNDRPTSNRQLPVFQAAIAGDSAAMRQLLNEDPQQVHAADDQGRQPLYYASQYDRKGIAKLLITSGADVNAADRFGMTPLHLAAVAGYKDIADLLVAGHADVNAKTRDGMTPLFLASANRREDVAAMLRSQGAVEPDIPDKEVAQSKQEASAGGALETIRKARVAEVKKEQAGAPAVAASQSPEERLRAMVLYYAPRITTYKEFEDDAKSQGWEIVENQAATKFGIFGLIDSVTRGYAVGIGKRKPVCQLVFEGRPDEHGIIKDLSTGNFPLKSASCSP